MSSRCTRWVWVTRSAFSIADVAFLNPATAITISAMAVAANPPPTLHPKVQLRDVSWVLCRAGRAPPYLASGQHRAEVDDPPRLTAVRESPRAVAAMAARP